MYLRLDEYWSDVGADILVYVDHRDNSPADSFISRLSRQEKNKIDRYIKEFASRGAIRNKEQFRCERSPIYAFKAHQARVLCFFLPNTTKPTLILTHGYSKQTNKISPTELDKADRMYSDVIKAQPKS